MHPDAGSRSCFQETGTTRRHGPLVKGSRPSESTTSENLTFNSSLESVKASGILKILYTV